MDFINVFITFVFVFVFCRAVLAACSRYFEAMFSGGLRESLDNDVNFRDSIHPEVSMEHLIFFFIDKVQLMGDSV